MCYLTNNSFWSFLAVNLIFLISAELLSAQYDLSGNGEIDLALTIQKEGEPISWFAYSPVSKEVSRLGEFGQTGWRVNVAPWLSEESAERAYIRKFENSEIRLKVEGVELELSLGEFPFDTKVIAGREIDIGGLADLAVIYQDGQTWRWKLFLNPFSDNPKVRSFSFGQKDTVPFLLRRRGQADYLAALKVRRRRRGDVGIVRFRGLKRKRRGSFRIRGFSIPDTSPRLIRSRRGRDDLIFISRDTTTDLLLLFRITQGVNQRVEPLVFQGDSVVFIGDYLVSQPGQDLMVYSERSFFSSNEIEGINEGDSGNFSVELLEGPIKVIGVDSSTEYEADSVSDLPFPTRAATGTVPVNSPTALPTLSVTPTSASINTIAATITSSPVSSPSVAHTASASPSSTAIPTVTLTPTAVNIAPTDITLTNNSVAENVTAATIGTLGAVDSNAGDTATFTLTSDPSGQLEIDGTTLKLQSGQALDFETQGAGINIQVTVTDSGGLSYTENFTVLPTNQNEAPTAITLTSNSVTEKSPAIRLGPWERATLIREIHLAMRL